MGFKEPSKTIQMLPDNAADPLLFAAEIPAEATRGKGGSMLRWAATATAAAALPTSDSARSSIRCPRRQDDWLGTVVLDPTEPSKLPLFEWFRDPRKKSNGNGDGGWVWYDGVLRPLAAVSRKGTTSLGWPKPKLKLEFKKGYDVEDEDDKEKKLVLRPPFVLEGEVEGEGGGGGGGASSPMSSVDLDSLWVRDCYFFFSFFSS